MPCFVRVTICCRDASVEGSGAVVGAVHSTEGEATAGESGALETGAAAGAVELGWCR